MFDTAAARRMMVDGQVRTADVTAAEVLDAMLEVPRERFLPAAKAPLAYLDGYITVAKDRVLLRPMVLAKLLQAARVRPGDRVLDVGCAGGYSSALLARLAGAVVALEEDAELARQAREALAASAIANVELVSGPLSAGWAARAPYDVIFLNGATAIVPEALGRQLKSDGRVIAVDAGSAAGKATIYRLIEGRLVGRPIFDAFAKLLPGFAAQPAFVF